jgi:transposase
MKAEKTCPRCSHKKLYTVRRGKRRCASCKYEWTPHRFPLHLRDSEWRKLLHWFMHGLTHQAISEETGINRWRILRALAIARTAIATDVPDFLRGFKDMGSFVDGHSGNNGTVQENRSDNQSRGMKKPLVIGLLCRSGKVWADIVPDDEAQTLLPLIAKGEGEGPLLCPVTGKGYTGVAVNGRLYRLGDDGERGEQSDVHSCLQGFWAQLKRKLASKGGIRKERLPLYLAEYAWRYNNRECTVDQKVGKLLKLLENRQLLVAKTLHSRRKSTCIAEGTAEFGTKPAFKGCAS